MPNSPLAADGSEPEVSASSRAHNFMVAALGTVLVTAYALLGALQILVLNPLAAVPGKTLEQIHAEMALMNESLSAGPPIIFAVIGVALALLVGLIAAPRRDATLPALIGAYLGILVAGTPAYFVASFGPGMALADAFGISGADYSSWSRVLYGVSLLALVALIGVVVFESVRSARAKRLALVASS